MAAPSNYGLTKNDTIAEILSCEICFERFNDSLGKAPKMLTCRHTFCACCLKRVAYNHTISCPNCRNVTRLGAKSVDDLDANMLVSRLSYAVEEAADDNKQSNKALTKKWRSSRGSGDHESSTSLSYSSSSSMSSSADKEDSLCPSTGTEEATGGVSEYNRTQAKKHCSSRASGDNESSSSSSSSSLQSSPSTPLEYCMLLCLLCKQTPSSVTTCVCVDCKTVKYTHGIPLCNDCAESHPHQMVFEGHKCISVSEYQSRLASMRRMGSVSCEKHPDEQMKMFCKGCSKVVCSVCAITEHHSHNVIMLRGAVEAERADISELCAEASCCEEEIEEELQKVEQKRTESVDRCSALHLQINEEAEALVSRINTCRQKAHGDVEEKMSSLVGELDAHRKALEAMMSRSKESRAKLLGALQEACDVAIFDVTREYKKQLLSVVEEDVYKVDGMFDEEVMVSAVRVALEFGKLNEMFEVGSRRVGLERAVVLISRGAGMIGSGQLRFTYGSTDIWIPAGGSVTDAELYVSEVRTRRIRVFNVSTGAFVRDIIGDAQLGVCLLDVLISTTGPQGTPELYVCDVNNHRIAVLDPITGAHIRSIRRGEGEGVGPLTFPTGLMMQGSVGTGSECHLYIVAYGDNCIHVVNPVDGSHIRYIGQGRGAGPGQLDGPRGCTVLLGGEGGISELYVSEEDNHRVSVFDMATGAFIRHIGTGQGADAGQMDLPHGIALSLGGVAVQGGDHLLYVSESGNHCIQIFNARTGAHVGFLAVGDDPRGLRMHAATENRTLLFVSDLGKEGIKVYEV